MSVTIPTTEPAAITAGDTITWQISLPDYPASAGWTLKYALLGSSGKISISSTASADDHLINIPPASSTAYTAGTYTYQKYVEKGSGLTLERYTLASGLITVDRSLIAITTATDTRSHTKKCLDALEAVLENRASRSDLEYEINTGSTTRKIKSMPTAEVLKLRNDYAASYWRELNPGRLCPQINLISGRYYGR